MDIAQTTQSDVINPLPRVAPADPFQSAQASGANTLDQSDFLRLLTTQLQQQDPFEPVNNEEMLAQMAQFSALAGATEGNATLELIVQRLDTLIAAQTPPPAAPPAAPSDDPATDTTANPDPLTSQE